MTDYLFRQDAYLKTTHALVREVLPDGSIILDKSIFYGQAGGQPGDRGWLQWDEQRIPLLTTCYDEEKRLLHIPLATNPLPSVGQRVHLELDWALRYRHMRAHSLMHLLCAAVPYPVTGGAITDDGARLDFDTPEGAVLDKDQLTHQLNQLITANHSISARWITDEEMMDNLHLVRTASVKPPLGTGHVRLVQIGGADVIDVQPCGGTHVLTTAEIGPVLVQKIEKKGRLNRRVRLVFAA